MCVSALVPGLIVVGFIFWYPPCGIGFSNTQYPLGYCCVGGMILTLSPAGGLIIGVWGVLVGDTKFEVGFGAPFLLPKELFIPIAVTPIAAPPVNK